MHQWLPCVAVTFSNVCVFAARDILTRVTTILHEVLRSSEHVQGPWMTQDFGAPEYLLSDDW